MIALVGNVSTIADQRITQIQEYQKTTQNHWTVLARVWNLETERIERPQRQPENRDEDSAEGDGQPSPGFRRGGPGRPGRRRQN